MLFIKYVSDKYVGQPYAQSTTPKGASFQDMVALKGKPDIGDQVKEKRSVLARRRRRTIARRCVPTEDRGHEKGVALAPHSLSYFSFDTLIVFFLPSSTTVPSTLPVRGSEQTPSWKSPWDFLSNQ